MYRLIPDITKDFVLSCVSQEEIMERYTGKSTNYGRSVPFCSPLRRDRNPTCKFYYSKSSKLYMKDYSGHFHGDCFDVVAVMYPAAIGLKAVLEIIAHDFNLIDKPHLMVPMVVDASQTTPKEPSRIAIKNRPWNDADRVFWHPQGINRKLLTKFSVWACDKVWLNDRLHYAYDPKDPAYAYRFGEGAYKIYFPKRKEFRFLSNTTVLQGYSQLPETGDVLVITKSLKDVMVLTRYGIPAVAPQAEGWIPEDEDIQELKRRFKKVFSLYDFDLTGIRTANKLKRRYAIQPLLFTRLRRAYPNYGGKDMAEMYSRWSSDGFSQWMDYAKRTLADPHFRGWLTPQYAKLSDVPF